MAGTHRGSAGEAGPAGAGPMTRFVVVTGLSGAGKSAAIRALEDLGYLCVDNLPTVLIPTLADLDPGEGARRDAIAVVVDARDRSFPDRFAGVYTELRARGRLQTWLIFLEASDAALLRRFSETRRPHPLAPAGSVIEGILTERARAPPDKGDVGSGARHLRPHGARAAPGVRRARRGEGRPGAVDGDAAQLRLQARSASRIGPALRCPLPAESVLRSGPEEAERPRPGGPRLRVRGPARPDRSWRRPPICSSSCFPGTSTRARAT